MTKDEVYYRYDGKCAPNGSPRSMTLTEVRNRHDVFIWAAYELQHSGRMKCFPHHATLWGARDGVKREPFIISLNDIVFGK